MSQSLHIIKNIQFWLKVYAFFNSDYIFVTLRVNVTYLTTLVFLYQKHHPDDGWITSHNTLVKIIN